MKKTLLRLAFVALPMFGFAQTYFSDNFDDEDISDWTLYDQDGDGYNRETVNLGTGYTAAIASYSYDNDSSTALTPNNYIVSPAVNLSTATSAILKFKVKSQDPDWAAETYSVYATTTNTVAGFLATTPLLTENAASNGVGGVFYTKTIDLSAFAGQSQVYIAFRHHNSTDMFSIHIDDVSVEAAPTTAPGCAALTSPANGATNLAYLSQTLS
ncbi:choice-of-anchor J domain-containing protein [Epilithonimonas vandammei]|uniref:choice-of-anchor J domain-containing protein n=1 Tax=Epilithonimonas vandammei TaxID=2487072 RepID=UPI00289DB8CC|nr:choice-of-anchor J domain-containing protein [Epilithonimonas vandammei]